MRKHGGLLIALSIVVGLVLACAILPLGGFAILVASVDRGGEGGPTPATKWQEQQVSGSGTDRVVIIDVTGIIGSEGEFGGVSQSQLLSQIRQAGDDPLVKAVVLRVDSPGGGVVASNEIHEELKRLREQGKYLVVSMGSVAASGGYYIATAADSIYANPDTITGSLGVIITSVNYEEAFDKLGLEQVVYKSGKLKDILSPARDATDEEKAILQSFVDQAYQGFVDVIAEGRAIPREQVLQLADGRIYSGRQAQELHLVDELGNLESAIAGAKNLAGLGEDALVVRYRGNTSLQDIFFNSTAPQQPADPLGVREVLLPDQPLRLEYRLMP